jgi:hypothetical protein
LAWIHQDDEVAAIRFLIENQSASGVYNLSAPNPMTNAGFTKALGSALHRPVLLFVPSFALKILLAEMSTVVLDGQRAVARCWSWVLISVCPGQRGTAGFIQLKIVYSGERHDCIECIMEKRWLTNLY